VTQNLPSLTKLTRSSNYRPAKAAWLFTKIQIPTGVARDLKELLSDDDLGVVPFNVPSVITEATP